MLRSISPTQIAKAGIEVGRTHGCVGPILIGNKSNHKRSHREAEVNWSWYKNNQLRIGTKMRKLHLISVIRFDTCPLQQISSTKVRMTNFKNLHPTNHMAAPKCLDRGHQKYCGPYPTSPQDATTASPEVTNFTTVFNPFLMTETIWAETESCVKLVGTRNVFICPQCRRNGIALKIIVYCQFDIRMLKLSQ